MLNSVRPPGELNEKPTPAPSCARTAADHGKRMIATNKIRFITRFPFKSLVNQSLQVFSAITSAPVVVPQGPEQAAAATYAVPVAAPMQPMQAMPAPTNTWADFAQTRLKAKSPGSTADTFTSGMQTVCAHPPQGRGKTHSSCCPSGQAIAQEDVPSINVKMSFFINVCSPIVLKKE